MLTLPRLLPGVLVLLFPALLHAGDTWPSWRGPSGQGVTDEKGLPTAWGGKTSENVLWKVPLPGTEGKNRLDHNQSSPVVWKDRVFLLMVYWPEGVNQTEYPEHHVACYSTTDGKQLWDVKVQPGPWLLKDLRGGYSAPTPCTDGERVYVLFGSSVLAALECGTGKQVWRKEVAPYAWDVAIGTSPILHKDTVFVLADGNVKKDSRLVAFDKKTGDIKWEQKRPTVSWNHSTPLLTDVKGKPQLIVAASNAVQGLDPDDGKVIWWATNKGDVPTPIFGGGVVYSIDGRGGPGIAVDPTGEGDVSKKLVKWQSAPIPEGYGSASVLGEYIYRVHNPGIIKCIKLADGAVAYSERLPQGLNPATSPITTPENRVYIAGGGKSVVVQAGPKCEVLATNDLGDPSATSPAVAGGRLYINGGKFLYCIGIKK
jgi:outer membrane protein assembly factor BamB